MNDLVFNAVQWGATAMFEPSMDTVYLFGGIFAFGAVTVYSHWKG